MYPDIYKIINPMVCRACDNNTQPVTEYLIEQMTDDIYDNAVKRFEVRNVINLNIETREEELYELFKKYGEIIDVRIKNNIYKTFILDKNS